MILNDLANKGLIHPPKFLIDNTHFLTRMGSDAYGVSNGSSDVDVCGFCIPPKHMIFPHLAGEILDFGTQKQRFNSWQEHHIKDTNKEYDFAIYSIVSYFSLAMENNPNMLDVLFVPRRCIIHSTAIGEFVRDNRRKFLHKGAWYKFKGYAYSQMHKLAGKQNAANPKRAENIKRNGYDEKFAYHIVRLLNEVEQILTEGDLDLERNSEQLKSIRRGEWPIEKLHEYFTKKESDLESVYNKSELPHSPNEEEIKQILIKALEMHYGNLDNAIDKNLSIDMMIDDIKSLIVRYTTPSKVPLC
jgi:uncharacterized protein